MPAVRYMALRAWTVFLPLVFLSLAAPPASFILTLVEVELIVNDHVGDEWTHVVRVDGLEMRVDDSMNLASADAYRIECNSREEDPHYPDSGKRSLRMSERDVLLAAEKGGFTVDVTVREEHGEYAGSEAVWRYHFTLR